MAPTEDTLTLDALLSDPMTHLVMRSDNLTLEDVAQAFDEARASLARAHDARYARGPDWSVIEMSLRWSGC